MMDWTMIRNNGREQHDKDCCKGKLHFVALDHPAIQQDEVYPRNHPYLASPNPSC
jgi:hypothetical protein